jgi:2-keto-4-pentenoate hydratase/2-oxohepta-3-ene-1,7-dioic acid hydratase in catechol pathway
MKLFRHGPAGDERPGVIGSNGASLDVSAFGEDFDEAFFTNDGLSRLRAWLEHHERRCPTVEPGVRRGPVVAHPSKIICVGMNYAAHAREQGMEPPKEPVLFMKATTALCGPDDDLLLPRGSVKTDWEVELGVVIGKNAKYVPENHAMDYVAGYCVINDVSEREYQIERGGQWDKGKGCDTFGPTGPWLVTKDEVSDPQNLAMWLEVDGHRYQNGSTKTMIFNVPKLVSYLSHFMSLQPGDVISTGTPPGVGMGQKPNPIYLKAGQTMRLGIAGLGEQQQKLVQA